MQEQEIRVNQQTNRNNISHCIRKKDAYEIKRVNLNTLIKRLKKTQKNENKERSIFVGSAIAFLVITGIIVSF